MPSPRKSPQDKHSAPIADPFERQSDPFANASDPFDDASDPFTDTAPAETGPADDASRAELSDALASFQARDQAEADRRALATDAQFFTCLVFRTQAQRDTFLSSVGGDTVILDRDPQYADGLAIARHLDIPLPTAPRPRVTRASARYRALPTIHDDRHTPTRPKPS